MLICSFKENYYENAENSIVGSGTVICLNGRQDDLTKKKKVIWEPTGTGFYHPKLTHAAAD